MDLPKNSRRPQASSADTNFLQDFGTTPTQILAVPSLFSPHVHPQHNNETSKAMEQFPWVVLFPHFLLLQIKGTREFLQ